MHLYLITVLTKVIAIVFVFENFIAFVIAFKYYAMYLDPSLITSNQNDRHPAENLLFLILLVKFYKNPQSVVQPEPISKANEQFSQAKVNNKHTSVLFSTAYCSTTFTTSSQRSHCTELATRFTGA